MEERKKILNIMEKYKTFFEEWDADVAFGTKGINFFYVMDREQAEEFDIFNAFETADELETMIVSCLADNVSFCLDSIAEDRNGKFNVEAANDAYNSYFPARSALEHMFKETQWMAEESAKWFSLMEKTYRVISNIGQVELNSAPEEDRETQ